jgi:TRAP-type C4-dicarboxylate transport system permease small subunit
MKYIYKIEEHIVIFLIIVIFIILFYQVLQRYLFGNPLVFAGELSRYLFIWSVMISAAIGIRRGSHTNVTYFMDLLFTKKTQLIIDIIRNIFITGFLFVLTYYGIFLTLKTMNVISAATRLPWGLIYISLPVGSLLMIIHVIENILRDVIALNEIDGTLEQNKGDLEK